MINSLWNYQDKNCALCSIRYKVGIISSFSLIWPKNGSERYISESIFSKYHSTMSSTEITFQNFPDVKMLSNCEWIHVISNILFTDKAWLHVSPMKAFIQLFLFFLHIEPLPVMIAMCQFVVNAFHTDINVFYRRLSTSLAVLLIFVKHFVMRFVNNLSKISKSSSFDRTLLSASNPVLKLNVSCMSIIEELCIWNTNCMSHLCGCFCFKVPTSLNIVNIESNIWTMRSLICF